MPNGAHLPTRLRMRYQESKSLLTILPHLFHYDFSKLQQDHAELKHCRFFQPSQKLLSLIWDILLMRKSPDLNKVLLLKQSGFGKPSILNWCKQKFVPDPCGDGPGYERLVACFIEILMLDCNSRSVTAQGYAQSINKLFEYRSFPIPPANPSDRENMTSKLSHARA